ncbi:precorrin-2 C(20)-methyltransferase [Breoghania sp. L-A4]|uniref:precorrin-2 C(20)-methyltransferase n=1 Tax=Breoghania sp. L-A4 TaxID=2304600 RepID=UPI003204AA3E
MTLKAHRLITGASVIAYPAPDTGESFARSIAADFIPAGTTEIPIVVPMRSERFPAQEVYDGAARAIAGHLDAGRDVVVLCEGDPFFYGSFMYLFERLADRYPSEIVPGVTSMTACAAALRRPLAARNDQLSVIPATLPESALRARLASCDAAAIIKLGRHLPKVRGILHELGLTESAGYVERATLDTQKAGRLSDIAPDAAPYFSMILIYKGDEPWSLELTQQSSS